MVRYVFKLLIPKLNLWMDIHLMIVLLLPAVRQVGSLPGKTAKVLSVNWRILFVLK